MLKLLNLDEISSDDREILLGGKKYIIPGDLPVMSMLKLIDNSNKLQETPNDVILQETAFNLLADIFMIKDENFDAEKFKKRLTMMQYTKLIGFIFGGFSEEGKKPEVPEEEKKQLSI